jgi:ribokinase
LDIEKSAVVMASKLATAADLVCVMTLGPLGCVAMKPDGNGWKVDAKDLGEDIQDTTGAGDTFCGVFAGCVFKGLSVQESLRRASVAGSLACREVGAQSAMPHEEEIEEFLLEIPRAEAI